MKRKEGNRGAKTVIFDPQEGSKIRHLAPLKKNEGNTVCFLGHIDNM